MKAILITLAAGILVASIQQYRIVVLQRDLATSNAAVQTQNNAVDGMKTAGQLETSQAENRVDDVLLNGEQLKRSLPKGTGPKVMNQFMREVFP